MTKVNLTRLRVTDSRETKEPLWFSADPSWFAASSIDEELFWGDNFHAVFEHRADDRERQVAIYGHVLQCVKAGVEWPHWVAAKAAFLARELRAWKASKDNFEAVATREATAQFAIFRDIGGDGFHPDPRWPKWRTSDVLALARTIYRDQNFSLLPILADALQDAGCDDEAVLSHCHEGKNHVRGCWVVDLAMGIG